MYWYTLYEPFGRVAFTHMVENEGQLRSYLEDKVAAPV
jgi:hypothetical protein